MTANRNLYMFQSIKTKGLYCFSRDSKGGGLPASLAPWQAFGVLRYDQIPPHRMSREAIESGIDAKGYQLWRNNTIAAASAKTN